VPPISGSCESRFDTVKAAFAQNLMERGDLGAAVCIYIDGQPVVDLWGGYADAARTRPWERDTIACVASTGKGITSICLLRLVQRGLIDLDMPVAHYWPEFGQAGKHAISVRWLLSHRAGLPAVRKDMSSDAMFKWHPFVEALAEETPWWEPGTRHGYHATTFGFLVGELVRRVSGQSIGQFLQAEIGKPLNADFFIGVPESEDARAAEMLVEPPPPPGQDSWIQQLLNDPQSMAARTFFNPPRPPQGMNNRVWRAAEIPCGERVRERPRHCPDLCGAGAGRIAGWRASSRSAHVGSCGSGAVPWPGCGDSNREPVWARILAADRRYTLRTQSASVRPSGSRRIGRFCGSRCARRIWLRPQSISGHVVGTAGPARGSARCGPVRITRLTSLRERG
jgi:CubicO group peptidase (beta-lactamase class C family)